MKWLMNAALKFENKLKEIKNDEGGQAFSEYAIVIGVVAVLIIATVILFKDAIVGVFTRIINALNGVGT